MTLSELIEKYSAPIEEEMNDFLNTRNPNLALYGMIKYQLGWQDTDGNPVPVSDRSRFGGKKLRGTLCLLAAEAVGGDYTQAVPAAAELEFIHNFSLVHDDIEDGDESRRHRPTVWKVWGIPHGINTGSAMQALAVELGLRVSKRGISPEKALEVCQLLDDAMLRMTEGQFMDISFESRDSVSVDEYFQMTSRKTGALIDASLSVGALLGGAGKEIQNLYRDFGMDFGLAFQARDDYLGIWGDPKRTGKPVGSDILAHKKSLPISYALETADEKQRKGLLQALSEGDVPCVMEYLEVLKAKDYTNQVAEKYTELARKALEETGIKNAAQDGIWMIADYALQRER